jgi:hypothetical protein
MLRGDLLASPMMSDLERHHDPLDDIRLVWRELRRLRKATERLLLITGVAYGLAGGALLVYLVRMFV